MADDSSAQKVDPSQVAEIVRSYVAQNNIGVDQVAGLIATVHRTLSGLGTGVPASVPLEPAVPIRRSVQRDHVICLECGFRGQMIRRHINIAHGLDPAEYRVRWQLPTDYPLTAPSYSQRRSTMAKEIGLGRPREAVLPPPAPEVVAPPPKRRGRKPQSAAVQ